MSANTQVALATQTPPTPRPQRSLNHQVVLEEDEYTAALSEIIARDFFPSLVHLDATNEYLDALSSRDPHLINASIRRLQEVTSTPADPRKRGWETPLQTPRYRGGNVESTPMYPSPDESGRPTKRTKLDTTLSLDAFQARYTSEDNSSFTEILDEENRTRKEQWSWAWDAQIKVEGQKMKALEGRERMLIEGRGIEGSAMPGVREKFMVEAAKPAGLITDGREAEVGEKVAEEDSETGKELILHESEQTQVDVMARKKDTRSTVVDGWKFKARNSLMFPPDADSSPYHQAATLAAAGGDPKAIKHGNTRLPEQDESLQTRSSSAPPSPTRSRIDAAIAGTPYRPRSPTINSFSLVPNIPSPTPSELGPQAVKQLMTWGTLNATPRIISSQSDVPIIAPSTPFHLPPISSREAIAQKLSNNASKSLRAKAELLNGGKTPGISLSSSRTPMLPPSSVRGSMAPPTFTPRTPRRADAAGALTPAARRLLSRTTLGTAASRRAEAMNKTAGWEGLSAEKEKDMNKVRWTPTPSAVTRREF